MIKGKCLCGMINIEISGELPYPPEACHCTQCRKHTGHFLAGINVERSQLKLEGEEAIKWYDSSDKVQRGFCSNCGSTLFWKPTIKGYKYTSVAMGILDSSTGLTLSKHTFVKDKGDYYEINDNLPQHQEF